MIRAKLCAHSSQDDWGSQGFVTYNDETAARGSNGRYLINYDSTTGENYIGVDYWSILDGVTLGAAGRGSVRIETEKTYTHGLFIIDLAHMPSSRCGLWPAFWTASNVSYPSNGEIDIIENIHMAIVNKNTLHTDTGCQLNGNEPPYLSQQTDIQNSYNCDDQATYSNFGSQYQYQGCSGTSTDAHAYGDAFNIIGGGVYAMEWTSAAIKMWHFPATNIPSDITSGSPLPAGWGQPVFTTLHGDCNIDHFFKDHRIILNTDFCGNWAGLPSVWKQSGCYDMNDYPTCQSYVAANPGLYSTAYWSVNSIKVYQDVVVSSSSSSVAMTSTRTSSTAA